MIVFAETYMDALQKVSDHFFSRKTNRAWLVVERYRGSIAHA